MKEQLSNTVKWDDFGQRVCGNSLVDTFCWFSWLSSVYTPGDNPMFHQGIAPRKLKFSPCPKSPDFTVLNVVIWICTTFISLFTKFYFNMLVNQNELSFIWKSTVYCFDSLERANRWFNVWIGFTKLTSKLSTCKFSKSEDLGDSF